MPFNTLTTDLDKLNSMTKYPSIDTYHEINPSNGTLLEGHQSFKGRLLGTEKVDGTNGRVIFLPDGYYIIGSRTDLLCAKGDLIGNPALGIVQTLKPLAERLVAGGFVAPDFISVIFLEVYGGNVSKASKNYTSDRSFAHRLFDMVEIKEDEYKELFSVPIEKISTWRDTQKRQRFYDEATLNDHALQFDIERVPAVFDGDSSELPSDHDGMLAWLQKYAPKSRVMLDENAGGTPEGVVIRTPDRSQIAKIRYEDYERTLRKKGQSK